MTHKEISDKLEDKRCELMTQPDTVRRKMMLNEVARLQFLYLEDGIINVPNRVLAILIICDVLPSEISNRRKNDKVAFALGCLWDCVQTITSQERVSELLGVHQSTISKAYDAYLMKKQQRA